MILCLTGFNYNFNSLRSPDEKPNELYESIHTVLTAKRDFMFILQLFFPLFRPIVRVCLLILTEDGLSISLL